MTADIASPGIRLCQPGIVNALLGIQTYILLIRNGDPANMYRCKFVLFITAAGNKCAVVTGGNINPARRINTQRTQIADDEPVNDAVGFHFPAFRVIGFPDLPARYGSIRPGFRFLYQNQRVIVSVFHGYVSRIRVGQLFQVGNGRLASARQFVSLDFGDYICVHADALCCQRHISALHVRFFALRLGADAAFLVHDRIADGIEKLFLRPGKFHLFRIIRILQRLISLIRIQILFRTGISRAVCFGKHIPNLLIGLPAAKQLILFLYPDSVILRILFQAPDVGAFIVRSTGHQARIDPVADQILLIYVIPVIHPGQCVNHVPVPGFQAHVSFQRYDRTHPHIARCFRDVNIVPGLCAQPGRIRAFAKGFGRRIHHQGLRIRANGAVQTGNADRAAPYRSRRAFLGNIPLGGEYNAARLAAVILPTALHVLNDHISGQHLAL